MGDGVKMGDGVQIKRSLIEAEDKRARDAEKAFIQEFSIPGILCLDCKTPILLCRGLLAPMSCPSCEGTRLSGHLAEIED